MNKLRSNPKHTLKTFFVFGFTSLVAASSLFASSTVWVDEWGNGINQQGPGGPFPPPTTFQGIVGPDPSGGIAGNVLYYMRGVTYPGDVIITDANSQVSDIIRFWSPTLFSSPSYMIFYSALPGVGETPSLADTGLPVNLLQWQVTIPEMGDHNYGYADYSTLSGIGGSGATQTSYRFISDGVVPEPGAGSLALLGGGLLLAFKRRFTSSRKQESSH